MRTDTHAGRRQALSVIDTNECLDQAHIHHCQVSLCSGQGSSMKSGLNQRMEMW